MRLGFLFLLLMSAGYHSRCQTLSDTLLLKKGIEYATAIYDRVMEGNLHVYNGSEYIPYRSLQDEHPFFLTDEWTTGTILYDGEWFTEMPMLFDLEKELVVISYYYKGIKMQLNSDRVSEFTLNGHRFINLKQTTDSIVVKKGFYDLLYDGQTKVLAKRSKKYFEKINETQLTQGFKEASQYYMFTHGEYSKVGTKRSILNLLSERKKELKIYIRKNRLFVSDREESLVRVSLFYDSLKP